MTASCFDFPAINQRLRQMRGEEYSGRFFTLDWDGKYQLAEDGHDWDFGNDWCTRCRFTHLELVDGIAPKVCPGGLPKVRTKYHENAYAVFWMNPNGMREIEERKTPVLRTREELRDWLDGSLSKTPPMIPYAPPSERFTELLDTLRKISSGLMQPPPFVPYMEIDK